MTPKPWRPRCRHCGNTLFSRRESPRAAIGNQLTADHIQPRPWRVDLPMGVRITWPACRACNELRAELGHCPAMLHFARDLARAFGLRRREAVIAFQLHKPPAEPAAAPRRTA